MTLQSNPKNVLGRFSFVLLGGVLFPEHLPMDRIRSTSGFGILYLYLPWLWDASTLSILVQLRRGYPMRLTRSRRPSSNSTGAAFIVFSEALCWSGRLAGSCEGSDMFFCVLTSWPSTSPTQASPDPLTTEPNPNKALFGQQLKGVEMGWAPPIWPVQGRKLIWPMLALKVYAHLPQLILTKLSFVLST